MRKALLPLALGVLAAGLVAQTPVQKLHADLPGGVAAKVLKLSSKTYKAGDIVKPLFLTAFDKGKMRYNFAYAKLAAGLHRRMGHYYHPGAYLSVYGKVYGKGEAGAKAPKFTWGYGIPGKKLNGVLKVYFHGFIYGPAAIKGFIGKKLFAYTKPGRYNFHLDVPVKNATRVVLTYGIREAGLKSTSIRGRGYFNATISFQFFPTVVQPGLKWVDYPNKNCAAGKLGHKGEVGFGKKFYITLSGAKDINPAKKYAMLFIGNSDKKFFFLNLPLNLASAGARGCYLYTNIMGVRIARVVNGAATIPFMVPGHGWFARFFKPIYFQFAYPSKKNRLGLVLTNYASIQKK